MTTERPEDTKEGLQTDPQKYQERIAGIVSQLRTDIPLPDPDESSIEAQLTREAVDALNALMAEVEREGLQDALTLWSAGETKQYMLDRIAELSPGNKHQGDSDTQEGKS